MPFTRLYIPKSSIPNTFNTILDVYKEIPRINSILKYINIVFFAICLFFSKMLPLITTLFTTISKNNRKCPNHHKMRHYNSFERLLYLK